MSPAGRYMMLICGAALLFGLNTRETMLYQLAAISLLLLLLAFVLSLFFTTNVRVRRVLPETCTAGEKLTYVLELENVGDQTESGLLYTEHSGAGYPSFIEFKNSYDWREQQRNVIDRKLGYYRWLWLIEQKVGAKFTPSVLPSITPGQKLQTEVSFLPLRRGYVTLGGYSLHRIEPLGLLQKGVVCRENSKILVLPKMYPVVHADLSGSRKYHRGGVSRATSSGDSGEFVSLREYRPGDPVKHIDWKATAKAGTTIVRQYQEEYFTRYGIVLDTFIGKGSDKLVEEAVSVAASIVVRQDTQRDVIDLLFAGDSCTANVTMGRGMAMQQHMLEVLACIPGCRTKQFSVLTEMVAGHASVLSGLILILLEIDEQRQELLQFLDSVQKPYRVVLVTTDGAKSKEQVAKFGLHGVRIFDAAGKTKVVDLS